MGGAILISIYWMIMDPHVNMIRGGGGQIHFGDVSKFGG